MNKIYPAYHFYRNHEVFRVRFRLVSCLSLLYMEYRRDDDEEREDRSLPPIYFCKFLPQNPWFVA